jgi:RNA polymerase-binding transcription factor DksA
MLSPELLKKYKSLLEEGKKKILAEIKEDQTPTDMGDEPGPDDETEEAEAYFNKTAALPTLRKKLANIDSAFLKMKKGKYGICESCGKEVEKEVLEIVPESRFCRECNKAGR